MLVRNPLDTLVSSFNMMATASHSNSVADSDFETFKAEWEEFCRLEMELWHEFHEFWLKQPIAIHIVRYEDILENPNEHLRSLFQFILNVPYISGSRVEALIQKASTEARPEKYKPRKA